MRNFFNSLRDALSFLTILPVGRERAAIEEIGKSAYLFPLVGALIGILAAGIAYLVIGKLPIYIVAALVLGFIYYLTGLHHVDGLLDVGDALLVKADPHRKREILKDPYYGIGSITLFAFILLLTIFSYGALIQVMLPWEMLAIIVVAEISAKFTLVTVAYLGSPSHSGTGAYIIQGIQPFPKYGFAFLSAIITACLLLGTSALYIFLALAVLAWYVVILGKEHFEGVNGDLLGASHELGRLVTLLVLVAMNWSYVFL